VFSGDDWRVVHQDDALRVAFAPRGSNFAVDGALFPPLPQPGAAREPILLFEASVTSPTESGRVAKAARWFAPGQLVSRVKAAFPGQPIRILLVWPELTPAPPVASAAPHRLEVLAAAAGDVQIHVVDEGGLRQLGFHM